MNPQYAILYLDKLEIEKFADHFLYSAALSRAKTECRPHQTLRYKERKNRKMWVATQVSYFDGV